MKSPGSFSFGGKVVAGTSAPRPASGTSFPSPRRNWETFQQPWEVPPTPAKLTPYMISSANSTAVGRLYSPSESFIETRRSWRPCAFATASVSFLSFVIRLRRRLKAMRWSRRGKTNTPARPDAPHAATVAHCSGVSSTPKRRYHTPNATQLSESVLSSVASVKPPAGFSFASIAAARFGSRPSQHRLALSFSMSALRHADHSEPSMKRSIRGGNASGQHAVTAPKAAVRFWSDAIVWRTASCRHDHAPSPCHHQSPPPKALRIWLNSTNRDFLPLTSRRIAIPRLYHHDVGAK